MPSLRSPCLRGIRPICSGCRVRAASFDVPGERRPTGAPEPVRGEAVTPQPRNVQKVYLTLMLFSTLAASFIWGINTLFLLDAGLSATAAFAANACFTAGMVLFEVPTGVVADTWGRRTSYLLGASTLAVSTVLYWVAWRAHAPFWAWAVTSGLLGLGFTFFSGATEAWLVDALRHTGFQGSLEPVFAKAQVVTLVVAYLHMKDWGFAPKPSGRPLGEMRQVLRDSLRHGLGNPPVRWMMLSSVFVNGVVIYAAYAIQPYLLDLYGDQRAYGVAGLAAAIFAAAQIAGGTMAPRIRRLFRRRTSALLAGVLLSAGLLALLGVTRNFWVAIAALLVWGLGFAATMPIRQAYMNGLIPSEQRATVLSFDNLMGSGGGVVVQPALGRAADLWSYPASYLMGAAVQLVAAPLVLLARREQARSDWVEGLPAEPDGEGAPAEEHEAPAQGLAAQGASEPTGSR